MVSIVALGTVIAGCGEDAESDTATTDAAAEASETTAAGTATTAAAAAEQEPHWAYEGDVGPANWGGIDEEYETCESGMTQSPIDLGPGAVPTDIADPVINWVTSDLTLSNPGHTIKAKVPAGSTTDLNGVTYPLDSFHWHKPSENTVESDPFAMELHFVHKNADGGLAVLAVLIDPGDALPLYDTIWSEQPAVDEEVVLTQVDFTQLLPSELTTYVFPGSLTTPPCTEGVAWNVLTTPATMSEAQIDAFLYDGIARPTQPLNDRQVEIDES